MKTPSPFCTHVAALVGLAIWRRLLGDERRSWPRHSNEPPQTHRNRLLSFTAGADPKLADAWSRLCAQPHATDARPFEKSWLVSTQPRISAASSGSKQSR